MIKLHGVDIGHMWVSKEFINEFVKDRFPLIELSLRVLRIAYMERVRTIGGVFWPEVDIFLLRSDEIILPAA